jgi:hypothetical protein
LAKTCSIATILSVFCCIATILSSRSKIVFSFMPLYGAGMGFALLFMTNVIVLIAPYQSQYAILPSELTATNLPLP